MASSMGLKTRILFTQCLRSYAAFQQFYVKRTEYPLSRRCLSRTLSSKTLSLCQLPPLQTPPVAEKETNNLSDDSPSSCMVDPYAEETEPCLLCKANIPISYKNPKLLSQFVSPNTGRIYDRHITRLCQMQQDRITKAILRSRNYGYMPVMYRETFFLKDPNLFDVKYTGSSSIGDHIKFPGPDASGQGPITMVTKKKSPGQKPKQRRMEKVKLTKTERRKNKSR